MAYVVEIKPSARKRNPEVGRTINTEGSTHRFADRDAAEGWAEELTGGGRDHVWIQSAHPQDNSAVDAYLVSRNTRGELERAFDKRRRRLRGGDSSQQQGLAEQFSE
ncbi:hypothetical protein DM826_03560 [Halonotius aquaticus]|uniref:DUF8081 domain-containing protein n=1 Tax=Halonotius aquaticus TaxID=2216978 RepID=A0A3A6Q0T0_9EURY|nr:hypothetical protein [Halonotius aquaticus]RJX44165.1 hypothetical protein DM826_03560 [Halonotius aquaticus]